MTLKHVLILASFTICVTLPAFVIADSWIKLGDDLELLERSFPTDALIGTPMVFIRSKLSRYRIEVVRAREFGWKRATIKALTIKSNAAAGINANFFDENGKALGLVVSRGTLFQGVQMGGSVLTGIFVAAPNSISILPRTKFNPEGFSEAVQAGPRLLINGVRVAELREQETSSRRAGVCVDEEKRVIFYSVASTLSGITMNALQDALLSSDIKCRDALNLDGGGSAQLYLSNTIAGGTSSPRSIYIFGRDEIPVGLVLVPK